MSSDGDSSPENCAKCDQTDGKAEKLDHMDENSENETSENDEGTVVHGIAYIHKTLPVKNNCSKLKSVYQTNYNKNQYNHSNIIIKIKWAQYLVSFIFSLFQYF